MLHVDFTIDPKNPPKAYFPPKSLDSPKHEILQRRWGARYKVNEFKQYSENHRTYNHDANGKELMNTKLRVIHLDVTASGPPEALSHGDSNFSSTGDLSGVSISDESQYSPQEMYGESSNSPVPPHGMDDMVSSFGSVHIAPSQYSSSSNTLQPHVRQHEEGTDQPGYYQENMPAYFSSRNSPP